MTPNPLIPWLPELNPAWPVRRTRFLLRPENRPVRDDDGVVTAFRDGQVTLRENRRVDGFTIAVLEQGYQGVEPGDLVIHSMDAFAGAIGVCDSRGKCTPEYVIVNGIEGVADNRYYAYVLRLMAHRDFIRVICQSVRERAPRFRYVRLQEVDVPAPPVSVQRRIADYLDRKTADIDALIEKKQRSMAILDERRAALILRVVIGGESDSCLSSFADSPQGSVGSNPTRPIGYCVRMTGGGTPSKEKPEYWNGSIPWVSPKDMKRFWIDDSEDHVTEEALASSPIKMVDAGAVLMVVRGMILARTLPVAINSVPVVVNQDMKALNPRGDDLLPLFLGIQLQAREGEILRIVEHAAHGTCALRQDLFSRFPLVLPPLDAQVKICAEVDEINSTYGAAIGNTQKSVEQLHDYRQSLITAAVTGQLDLSSDPPLPAGVQP